MLAGLSVALVLIPQSLAYAELAGMPAQHGLWAAAVAPLGAAFFASSRYLQTGPVAVTSLLTLGALVHSAQPGTTQYVALAAVLALVVGLARVAIGMMRVGWISYLMSQPVILGFMSAAAILILFSQLPGLFGVPRGDEGVVGNALNALLHPGAWSLEALAIGLAAIGVIVGARRLSPRIPGVLVAALAALLYARFTDYQGLQVGSITAGLPRMTLDLPWRALPGLFLPGVVIALVGFAEAAAIARTYATRDREDWSPDREFVGQGVANLAAGLVGGFPVGGSFSRSSLGRLSGTRTRAAGFWTGLFVLAFLPFARILAELPTAVLAAIVTTAVWNLIDLKSIWRVRKLSGAQGMVAGVTFTTTLLFAPRIDLAVVVGIVLALGVHAYRELRIEPNVRVDGEVIDLAPKGVLWFASAPFVETELVHVLATAQDAKILRADLGGLGRIDLSGALALRRILDDAMDANLRIEILHVPPHAHKVVRRVLTGLQEEDDAEVEVSYDQPGSPSGRAS